MISIFYKIKANHAQVIRVKFFTKENEPNKKIRWKHKYVFLLKIIKKTKRRELQIYRNWALIKGDHLSCIK